MAGYTRNDTTNQIADGNVINAAPLDGEFNAIQAAFNVSSGHTHDGSTSGDGGPVSKLGPSQQLEQTTTALTPSGDNSIDLGTSSAEFKDLYLDGIAYIDRLIVAASDGSADGVGSHLQPLTNASFDLGSTTYLWNNAYLVNLNVRKNDAPVITLTNTSTDMLAADSVGSIVFETLDTQQSGVDVAKIDAVVVDSLDDTGGDDVKLVFQTGNAEALTTALTLQDDSVIAPHDVFLRSDAAVLNFGADDDVNLTHVADTGLLLNAAMEFQFRDSGLTIGSTTDGQLDIDADTELELVAPTIDIDAATAVTIDTATLTITGAANVTGDLDVDNININGNSITSTDTNGNIGIVPNGDGKVNIDGDGSSGGVSVSDGLVDIRTGTGSRSQVKFYCESSNAHAQTLQPQPHSAGVTNTLTLPAGSDQEIVGASATQTLTNKTIDVDNNTVSNIEVDNFKSGVLDTDLSSVAGTDTTLASAKAIKAYVDTEIAAVGTTSTFGANIVFEGATANDFETTVAVTDPTADRTITLPDETGNVIIDAKAQEFTKTQNFNATTLTDASTIAWDTSSNQVTSVELTSGVGNSRAFGAPTNLIDGGVYVLMVKQDSTGSRTIGPWNAVFKWAAGRTPTLTTAASAKDIFTFLSDGTNLYEIGRSLNAS
tara:strand:+ start:1379 stop:3346 length:1968 start_codon:yes stop_codon:yes gene_type:complete